MGIVTTHIVMANAFGIIAALALLVAAYFGYQNKAALLEQRSELDAEQHALDTNNKTFDEKKVELAGLEADTKEANEKTAELKEQLDAQLATNKQFETDIEDKKDAVTSKRAEVEEGNEKLAQFGDLDDLKDNLTKLGSDIATLEGELLLRSNEIETRRATSSALQTESAALDNVLKSYAAKKSLAGINSTISRVVTDLGFVLLTGGDNAGIVRDSVLEVKREGETIGKLKVTATEPNSAAASLIPDSFVDGTTARVGDKVVAAQ